MLLTRRSVFRLAAGLPILAAEATRAFAFASKEFWESKPSTEWNAEEVERMLTKSPWAKDASVAFDGGPGGFGRGPGGGTGRSRGGIGFPGGGGIGYPGGGIGYPGGGTRGNGGGQPGGPGYPGGNGGGGNAGGGNAGGGNAGGGNAGGGNGGGRPSGGGGDRGFRGTVRWESALPVQEALNPGSSDKKPNPDFAKYYVLALIGDLPMVGGHRRGADNNDDDSVDHDTVQDERRQEMFKQYTKLERKGGPVQLEKIEEGSRVASKGPGTYFYFSRLDDISMDDKQVTFSTKLGPMEIRTKFTLKDMLYHGKLAL
jgi:hypothetical protein